MKKKTTYQQGDVLFIKIDEDTYTQRHTYGKYSKKRSTVIQEGEATGHAHRIDAKKFELLFPVTETFSRPPMLRLPQTGTIIHEEHNPIKLPKGTYEIKIIREYDHFREKTRKVID